MNRIERIQALLQSALTPAECVVDDESHLHAGHAARPRVAAITGCG